MMVPAEDLVSLHRDTAVVKKPHLAPRCSVPNSSEASSTLATPEESTAIYDRFVRLPTSDTLLTIVSLNVFRAFATNAQLLGYSYAMLADDDSMSPFPSGGASRSPVESFRPTAIQATIPHHPVYDVFPDPKLREAIILSNGGDDAVDMCWDLIGMPSLSNGMPSGLLVWGESHLIESWEVSEEFAVRNKALLRDCVELIASTNRWRAIRGEEPLALEATD